MSGFVSGLRGVNGLCNFGCCLAHQKLQMVREQMGFGVSGLGVAHSEITQRVYVISKHAACYTNAADKETDESRSWIESGSFYQRGGMLYFRSWRAPEAANGWQADGLERGLRGINLNTTRTAAFCARVLDDERIDACDKSFLSLSQGKEIKCYRTWAGAQCANVSKRCARRRKRT
jgi:hypothetical protein